MSKVAKDSTNHNDYSCSTFILRLTKAMAPKTPEGFVTFLFWHSMFLTAPVPLLRILRGCWIGGSGTIDFLASYMHPLGVSHVAEENVTSSKNFTVCFNSC